MARDWERAYREGDTPWDKGRASPPLAAFLRTHRIAGQVLVPGCGTGHDVRALSAQGAAVTGLDLVPLALEKARAFPKAGAERYLEGDFLRLPEALRHRFDWVVEHTCLCALELSERESYAASVRAALKPGGHYLAVFYREVEDYGGDGPPHPISETEIDALFGDDFETLEKSVPQESYPSRPPGSEEVRWMRLRSEGMKGA